MPVDPAQPAATAGGRTRAGNGMSRARAGILGGAASCVARYGTRKTTMGDIAREGGVAKATLYNHFRTKDDVLAALLASQVDELVGRLDGIGGQPGSAPTLTTALATAATFVSEHPVLRHLAVAEPALVASLITPGAGELWQRARMVTRERVSLAQAAGSLHARHDTESLVDASLRWVVSHALWPASETSVQESAHRLVGGFVAEPLSSSSAESGELRDEGDVPSFRTA